MAGRITQIATEVVRSGNPLFRATQVTTEVLRSGISNTLITQLSTEVLRGGNSNFRATQLVIEVLRSNSIRLVGTTDTLVFTPTISYTKVANEVQQYLIFTENFDSNVIHPARSLKTSSVFGQKNARFGSYIFGTFDKVPINVSLSQTLTFTSTSTEVTVRTGSISDTLVFTPVDSGEDVKLLNQNLVFNQSVSNYVIHNESISQTLSFNQFVARVIPVSISQSIPFSDIPNKINYPKRIKDSILGQKETRLGKFVFGAVGPGQNKALQDNINFVQTFITQDFRYPSLSQVLNLISLVSGVRARFGTSTQNLSFNEILSYQKYSIRVLHDNLTFNQTITYQKIKILTLNDHLLLSDVFARRMNYGRTISDTLIFKDPNIIIPATSVGFTGYGGPIIIPTANGVVVRKRTTLQGRHQTILLPPANLSDSITSDLDVSIKRTMTRRVYTYIKTSNRVKIRYNFWISYLKYQELKRFILNNGNDLINITNWKGEQFVGFLINNPFSLSSKSRRAGKDVEKVDVNLEFDLYPLNTGSGR